MSACATCDGFFYRKKTVAVVGGGDTACEEADYLSHLCNKVYMIVRKPYLRASEAMKRRVENNAKIEILYEHNTVGLYGEGGVEGAHVVKRKGEPDEQRYDLPIDGFFLAIGHKPNTDVFREWLDLDEAGYIQTVNGTPRTKYPECSPQVTVPTPCTGKPSLPQVADAWLHSRLNAICRLKASEPQTLTHASEAVFMNDRAVRSRLV